MKTLFAVCIDYIVNNLGLNGLSPGSIWQWSIFAKSKLCNSWLRKEFSGQSLIDQELNSTTYFARPFASWEHVSNENLKGLLRQ
jgi:hypothetical protein